MPDARHLTSALDEAARRARSAERARQHRAQRPGYTPRSDSKARTQPWLAEGVSRTVWYARRAQAQTAADTDGPDEFARTPDDFERTAPDAQAGQFRTRPAATAEALSDIEISVAAWATLRAIPDTPDMKAGAERVAAWQRYLDEARASHVYGRQALPTAEEHAATMAALRAGADAAAGDFLRADPGWAAAITEAEADEAEWLAHCEERAAIREFEGGLDRDEAERLALVDVRHDYSSTRGDR